MYSVCHNYLFILLFQMLAAGFGLTRPSSGQYSRVSFCNGVTFSNIWL